MTRLRFSPFDRTILILAVLCFFIFSYLLYDDHLLMSFFNENGESIAVISKTTLDVRFKLANDFRWTSASKDKIHVGDSIFTGENSDATIVLDDGSIVHVAAQSLIIFNKIGNKSQLILKQGKILSITGNAIVENQVQRAPAAIALPRPVIVSPGSFSKITYQINPDDTTSGLQSVPVEWIYEKPLAQFEVQFAHDMEFNEMESSLHSEKHRIQSPNFTAGSHFIRVRELDPHNSHTPWSKVAQIELEISRPHAETNLLPPTLKQTEWIHALGDPRPVIIEWQSVALAKSYMLETSSRADFKESKKITVNKTEFELKSSQPADIYLRVSSLGADNQVSATANQGQAHFILDTPVLLPTANRIFWADHDNQACASWNFNHHWSAISQAQKYILQISADDKFKNPMEFKSSANQLITPLDQPGNYYWRVRAVTASGQDSSPFSKASQFTYTYEKPLPPPHLYEPGSDMTLFFQGNKEHPFYMTWEKIPRAEEYALQIAVDPSFKKPVIDKKVKSNRLLLSEMVPKGVLYWRVHAVYNDHVSSWSEVRKMTLLSGRSAQRGK